MIKKSRKDRIRFFRGIFEKQGVKDSHTAYCIIKKIFIQYDAKLAWKSKEMLKKDLRNA